MSHENGKFQIWIVNKELAHKEPMGFSKGFKSLDRANEEFDSCVDLYGHKLNIQLRVYPKGMNESLIRFHNA